MPCNGRFGKARGEHVEVAAKLALIDEHKSLGVLPPLHARHELLDFSWSIDEKRMLLRAGVTERISAASSSSSGDAPLPSPLGKLVVVVVVVVVVVDANTVRTVVRLLRAVEFDRSLA